MRTKVCRYCREEFSDIDFPCQFDRMVTCGKVECMRQRRLERLGINPNNNK
jgi:hypothetical protein